MKKPGAAAAEYEIWVLELLAHEFPSSDPNETERKIRRKFRDKKLGAYDPSRVATLRSLKNVVQPEVLRGAKSAYYVGPRGKPDARGQPYADPADFDRERMTRDYAAAFPGIPGEAIRQFVDIAVFLYHVL
jgi:hypothetical protein